MVGPRGLLPSVFGGRWFRRSPSFWNSLPAGNAQGVGRQLRAFSRLVR